MDKTLKKPRCYLSPHPVATDEQLHLLGPVQVHEWRLLRNHLETFSEGSELCLYAPVQDVVGVHVHKLLRIAEKQQKKSCVLCLVKCNYRERWSFVFLLQLYKKVKAMHLIPVNDTHRALWSKKLDWEDGTFSQSAGFISHRPGKQKQNMIKLLSVCHCQ